MIPTQRPGTAAASRTVYVPGTPQDVVAAILILSAAGWDTESAVRLRGDLWRVEVLAAE